MRILKILLAFTCIVTTGWAVAGDAEQGTAAEAPKSCLFLPNIYSIDIIDNQNIAFITNNHKYYLNHLPYACPMLDRYKVIMYKTPLSSLCDLDIINVLDPVAGGFQYYGACGLGKFKPVSKEEIQQMKAKHKKTAK